MWGGTLLAAAIVDLGLALAYLLTFVPWVRARYRAGLGFRRVRERRTPGYTPWLVWQMVGLVPFVVGVVAGPTGIVLLVLSPFNNQVLPGANLATKILLGAASAVWLLCLVAFHGRQKEWTD